MRPPCFALLALMAGAVISARAAEWTVSTDFEGASARVEAVDQAERVIRLRPGGDPQRGWPCWWALRVDGVAEEETVTIDLGASDWPARNNGEETGQPLAAAWAMPGRAAFSTDGKTWQQTEPGKREGERIRYEVTGAGGPLLIAWGPPFTPTDTDALLAEMEQTLPAAKAFELARSREGRPVRGLRVSEAIASGVPAIWIQARQHAWESGSSWVARGLTEWLASPDAEAVWLRQHAELFIVPIMDVDNVATGNGGKEETPRDHNRDWAEKPVFPEVSAAQRRLLALAKAKRLAVFLELHNPAPSDLRPFFFTADPATLGDVAKQSQSSFLLRAAETISGPLAVDPKPRVTGPSYHPLWQQISNVWVNQHGNPNTVAVCLETAWNTPQSNTEGYRTVGRQLGQVVASYLRARP